MLNLLGILREAEASTESWTVVWSLSFLGRDLLGFHMFSGLGLAHLLTSDALNWAAVCSLKIPG